MGQTQPLLGDHLPALLAIHHALLALNEVDASGGSRTSRVGGFEFEAARKWTLDLEQPRIAGEQA